MSKLYVLVRKDLNERQQAVQAGHAIAEYFINSDGAWKNGTLVYLGVENELELDEWFDKLAMHPLYPFYEEYYHNELTAFAVLGTEEVQTQLKELKLL